MPVTTHPLAPWPPAPGSHRDTHPLDALLRGVSKRILYALAASQRDEYVHYALLENADLANDPTSDVLLTAHVGRQARDRDREWPLNSVCTPEQLASEEHLDELYAEMSALLARQIADATARAQVEHEEFLLEKLTIAWRQRFWPRVKQSEAP